MGAIPFLQVLRPPGEPTRRSSIASLVSAHPPLFLPSPHLIQPLIPPGGGGKKSQKQVFGHRGHLPQDVEGELGAQHADGAGGALGAEVDTALLGHAGGTGHPWVL